jgi:two-component system, OmpR family, sensor histidine kinase KdpD
VTGDGLARRGRLLVYAGMCEGAGTTTRMLEEGHRLLAAGIDVVVGTVATHRRDGVARLVEGLEVVEALSVTYRGVTVEELDPGAVIDRAPAVVLVDELWHENAPGFGRSARWGDVTAIRAAGIDVISTLDLGRLESLADAVETITGVPVGARLPDAVLDAADEVELVDVSASSLRRRVAAGDVVPPDRVRLALDRHFTEPNLATLRELALRSMARRVEAALEDGGNAGGRASTLAGPMLVLVEGGEDGRHAVRRAAMLAGALRVRLVALVPAASRQARPDRSTDPVTAEENAAYAVDLGAEPVLLTDRDVAGAIAAAAEGRRSAHLVLPRRAASARRGVTSTTLLDRIERACPALELHLSPAPAGPTAPGSRPNPVG